MNFQQTRRVIRYYCLKVLRQKGEPEQIAGGVALGAFLSFVLPPGVQMVVAACVAPLLRFNAIAAVAAVWISNPLTMPLIYPGALAIGKRVTGVQVRTEVPEEPEKLWMFMTDFRAHGRAIVLIGIGLLLIGAVTALVLYHVTRYAVIWHRRRRSLRRQKTPMLP